MLCGATLPTADAPHQQSTRAATRYLPAPCRATHLRPLPHAAAASVRSHQQPGLQAAAALQLQLHQRPAVQLRNKARVLKDSSEVPASSQQRRRGSQCMCNRIETARWPCQPSICNQLPFLLHSACLGHWRVGRQLGARYACWHHHLHGPRSSAQPECGTPAANLTPAVQARRWPEGGTCLPAATAWHSSCTEHPDCNRTRPESGREGMREPMRPQAPPYSSPYCTDCAAQPPTCTLLQLLLRSRWCSAATVSRFSTT